MTKKGKHMISRRHVLSTAATLGVAGALMAFTLPASATPGFPGYALSTNGNLAAGNVVYVATQSSALYLTINGVILTCPVGTGSTASGTVVRGTYPGTNQIGTITKTAFGSALYTLGPRTGGGNVNAGASSCTSTGGTVPFAVVGPEGAPNGGGPRSNTNPATVWPAWTINVTGVSTTQPNPQGVPLSGQVTPASIENIRATVYFGKTNSCHFEIGGKSPNGVYTTSPDNNATALPGGKVFGTYTNTSNTGTLSIDASDARASLRIWNVSNPATGCVGGAFTNGGSVTISGAYNVSAGAPVDNPIRVRS